MHAVTMLAMVCCLCSQGHMQSVNRAFDLNAPVIALLWQSDDGKRRGHVICVCVRLIPNNFQFQNVWAYWSNQFNSYILKAYLP